MIRYERSNEIDAGDPSDDDVAVSGGVSARCSRFSRDGFGGLFVEKNIWRESNDQVLLTDG